MRKLNDYISERTISEANYIVEKQTTIRATARAYNVSKSTVYVDVTKRLRCISLPLYTKVKELIEEKKLILKDHHLFISDKYFYLSNEILIHFI